VIEAAMRVGRFPRRVVHGDTKLNNILFSQRTGEAVCVVDLDTCMPGYSLYDFGDLVRFTAARCKEDEIDPTKAGTDFELFRALVEGYLESARAFLTDDELRLMPFAARLVTFTIGLRFLTDHLNGDVYFKVAREGHNLDRARVQFAMVASMEQQKGMMESWVRSCVQRRTLVGGGGDLAAAEA
jgi:Ser/Thr protein kinase RdoA (MazF antagonist)